MKLGEAMNTYHIALFEIKNRDYCVSATYDDKSEDVTWHAQKSTISIQAFNPLSLLALVVIADTYGERWREVATRNYYDELIENS